MSAERTPAPRQNPRPSLVGLVGLVLLAVYLWMRDRSWMAHRDDALPILLGFPLFWYLCSPFLWRDSENGSEASTTGTTVVHPIWGVMGAVLLGVGALLNINFPLALGWTMLFYAWLAPFLNETTRRKAARLLPLLVLSFPWLMQEGETIGWWFRLSGAWATENVFTMLGFAVERQGTLVFIQGIAIGVDAPCAGLNVLQSLLLAGTALAFVTPGGKRWSMLPLLAVLVGMSWLANVLRLLLLCFAALTYGVPFARGLFHTWGGLFALVLMFLLCVALFSWNGSTKAEKAEVAA